MQNCLFILLVCRKTPQSDSSPSFSSTTPSSSPHRLSLSFSSKSNEFRHGAHLPNQTQTFHQKEGDRHCTGAAKTSRRATICLYPEGVLTIRSSGRCMNLIFCCVDYLMATFTNQPDCLGNSHPCPTRRSSTRRASHPCGRLKVLATLGERCIEGQGHRFPHNKTSRTTSLPRDCHRLRARLGLATKEMLRKHRKANPVPPRSSRR